MHFRQSRWTRIAGASVLGTGVFWRGVVWVLDTLGRIDIALKLKKPLPAWVISPWGSIVTIVVGVGLLWWTGRTPTAAPVILYGADDRQVETPRRQVVKYALVAVAVACVGIVAILFTLRRTPIRHQPLATTAPAAAPQPQLPAVEQKKAKAHEVHSALLDECWNGVPGRKPKTYSDYSKLPGGANETRPWVVVSQGTINGGAGLLGDETIFLSQITLVNRGESSIVKDFELCLVKDGKAHKYPVAEIPESGITATVEGGTKTILPSDSLPEKTISTPVVHGNTAIGWVYFKVPGTDTYNDVVRKKEKTLPFAIMFKDYLDHECMFEGAWSADGAPSKLLYVPGAK